MNVYPLDTKRFRRHPGLALKERHQHVGCVDAVLGCRRDVGADLGESFDSIGGSQRSRDLLLELGHSQVGLRLVVGVIPISA